MFEVAEIFEQAGLAPAREVMKTVTDKEFVKRQLGEPRDSLEGYLFPDTYSFTKYTDYHSVLAQMVNHFKAVYKDVEAENKLGWSRHQIVTLASIIEKETGAPEERPVISAVFHNRMVKGMLLQTDPTIIYGKALQAGRIELNITRADLTRYTPYNTYVIKGLPPGPIANPGREALMASIHPAASDYLYFVSHNDGTHQFSVTYKEHAAAVQKFQLDPKAREGKSWRDLKKRAQVTPGSDLNPNAEKGP